MHGIYTSAAMAAAAPGNLMRVASADTLASAITIESCPSVLVCDMSDTASQKACCKLLSESFSSSPAANARACTHVISGFHVAGKRSRHAVIPGISILSDRKTLFGLPPLHYKP